MNSSVFSKSLQFHMVQDIQKWTKLHFGEFELEVGLYYVEAAEHDAIEF